VDAPLAILCAGGTKAIATHKAARTETETKSRNFTRFRIGAIISKKWYNRPMNKTSRIADLIRTIPNFPKEGILFRDVTGIFDAPLGLKQTVDEMCEILEGLEFERIAAPEARGFIFASALASRLGKAFVPVRKPGKLPRATVSEDYDLEYGTSTLHVHSDAITPGDRVVVIDDLLATGGTAAAAARLIERLGGKVVKMIFPVELEGFGARGNALANWSVSSLVKYPGK
jgi:adenine phosphoribosyltransferase